jgi:hypothetical protein
VSASLKQTYRLVVKKTLPRRQTLSFLVRLAPTIAARPTGEGKEKRPVTSLPLGVFETTTQEA